jgi:hypothetical protein
LGQFIDARPAQEFACPCHAKIMQARLCDAWSILENRHRPKFEDDKFLAIEAASPLAEYDWTAAFEPDGNRGNQKQRPKARYCRHGNNDVHSPLYLSLKRGPLPGYFTWRIK